MASHEADAAFLAGLKVLFVDDSPILRRLVADILTPLVGGMYLAEDGQAGLEAFQREQPDLLITDIQMPGMDGLTMVEGIRGQQPDLPVIVLTTFESSQYLLRSIDLGVDRYVVKPIDPHRLRQALLHCAHQLRAEHELRLHRRVEQELERVRHQESLAILARGMAHDYNNLMQAILAGVETARGLSPEGSPVRHMLGLTEKYTGIAQALGKQLLALGQLTDRLNEEGPLKPLVKAALRRVMGESPVTVELSFDPHLPDIRYNPERLGQALDALLTNALEAMPKGGRLEIQASVVAASQSPLEGHLPVDTFLCLSLKDSGPGIPPDLLPRIFEPYQSTKAKVSIKGKGLGLAICRSILLAHEGHISVESACGQGSTFRIYLPIRPMRRGGRAEAQT